MNRKLSSLKLPWPVDWQTLFKSDSPRPLILEIGFGYGQFLLHLARTNPDAHVIGVEISNRCLSTVEGKIERFGLANVRVIRSTAETALHHLFEPESLTQIHINFPDPWFKTRHGHRRLMQRDTLDAIVSRLAPGGLLYLATDIIEYAEMSHALLTDTPGLANRLPTPWTESPLPERVVTKYESKARHEGRACYYFTYCRNTTPAPAVPVITEFAMPHLVFSTPLLLDAMLQPFQRIEVSEGDTHIILMHGFYSTHAVLFEVFVKEPTIDQHFAVMLLPRENRSEYTLQLGSLGHPRPTAGVHRTVTLLADWLLSLHPEAHIIKQNLQDDD
jgi:tRNA (guanine-N(7)-)-methyltransferase